MSGPRSIYGIGLRANVALAALQSLDEAAHADITLDIGDLPHAASGERAIFYSSEELDERGVPGIVASRIASGTFHRIDYADGTSIVLDASASRIWAHPAQDATIEDTAAYVLGPALGFALHLRGVTCLHASAIVMQGRAIAFVGAAGAGKSTLAAAFANRGYAVLTDDVAALTDRGDRFDVRPAYPRVRLWPESVELLFGARDALPRMTPTWDKRFLSLGSEGAHRFARCPAPLAAVFVIDPRGDATAPRIDSIARRHALMSLVRDSYAARLLGREQRARQLDILGRIALNVPVFRLARGDDSGTLGRLCDLVEAHMAQQAVAAD